MPTQIADQLSISPLALAPDADAFAGTKTTDLYNMGLVLSAAFVGVQGTGATGTYKVTVEACSDNAGNDNEAIAFRYKQAVSTAVQFHGVEWTVADKDDGFTITAGSNQQWLIGLVGSDMPEDKPWVRVKTVEVVDSPIDGAIFFLADGLVKGPSELSLT